MREDLLIQLLREAIRDYAKVPFEERQAELVRAGIIDEKGRVIVRMPVPPKTKRPKKGKKLGAGSEPSPNGVDADDRDEEGTGMREDPFTQLLREAIRDYAKVPFEERQAELVRAGIIDEKGRVIVRMPVPPKAERPKKRAKKKKKPKADS